MSAAQNGDEAETTLVYYDDTTEKANGQLLSVTDANGVRHEFAYDKWGYYAGVTEGLWIADVYDNPYWQTAGNDDAGRQTSGGDAGGSGTTGYIDSDDQTGSNCALLSGPTGTQRLGVTPAYGIDPMLTCSIGNTYNNVHQPTLLNADCLATFFSANTRKHTFEYDALGRMTEHEIESNEHAQWNFGTTFTPTFGSYGYDPEGRVLAFTGPDNFYDDPSPSKPDVERFEPGGDAAPADEDAHYLQWCTHYIPYEHGLPEMLDDYNGVDVRHGTDFYQFDGSETIQPELLNLVRFAISYICGTTCLNNDGGCNEQPFGSVAHHNPRFRGSPDQGLCCVPMPIRFYWSGSNRFPHFRRRGKGDPADWSPLDTRPLKNHPDEPVFDAAQAARKSWRGIDNLFRDPPMDNPFYGGGVSWGTAPAELQLWDEPAHGGEAVYALYQHVGLQEGDVIDPVHIQEIIDAVDYLIDYGVWSHAPICTRQRTPSSYLGWPCGYQENARACTGCDPLECEADSSSEILNCNRCCPEWDHNGTHCSQPGWVCDEHSPPTLEDCRNDCRDEKCGMSVTKSANTCVLGSGCCIQDRSLTVDCNEGTPIGCGSHSAGPGACPEGAETPGGGCGACGRRAEGMSYYACTPDQCEHGWDDQHGGSFKKSRFDDDCPVNNVVATGSPGNEFSGNCWGDIWSCGTVYPLGGAGDGPIAGGPIGGGSGPVPYACARMWFGQVAAIQWDGLAVSWLPGCDGFVPCGGGGDPMALPPPLPGMGLHDVDGDPLCTVFPDSHACICSLADFPVCRGESVWVAMDLNLDGNGRPYRNFPGRSCELPPYTGPGVPVLRDYDLTKDPDTWMHDCPCETWTGAGVCI